MKDLYTEVTDRIIEQLEQGVIPWQKPWTGVNSGAISHATGRAYSLLNQLILSKPGEYLTWNQVKKEGGNVRRGAKAKTVVFWKVLPKERRDPITGEVVTNADGNPIIDGLPVLRYFQVFHIDDCDGIAPKWADKLPTAPAEPDAAADAALLAYIDREHITLEQTISDRAYYSPVEDLIHLPIREQFDATAEYYSTAFHEATHSTGHATRLNRFNESAGFAAFGSESYSKEELVAEIGAASILHTLGLETPSSFNNSAAYIQSWLTALRNDKRMIVSAAARAEKAVKRILDIHDEPASAAE